MLHSVVWALALAPGALTAPVGGTRTFAPVQLKGCRVWESGPDALYRSTVPGYVRRGFYVRFLNETREEVVEVDVRLRVSEGGRTTFLSSAFPLRQFDNVALPLRGSLLPYNKSRRNTFVVEYPVVSQGVV